MRSTWLLAWTLASCTPLVGYDRDGEPPLDNGADAPMFDVADRQDRQDVITTMDAGDAPHTVDASDAPGDTFVSSCLYGTACNPRTNAGCAAAESCSLTRINPTSIEAMCRAPGAALIGATCDATNTCASGLQCILGRCLRLCCGFADDAMCATDVGAGSRCAVASPNVQVQACTIPGPCDYESQSGCSSNESCIPQDFAGNAICVTAGSGGDGATCQVLSDCGPGLTCVISGAAMFGSCRPICNRRVGGCDAGMCGGFANRPLDFGACR